MKRCDSLKSTVALYGKGEGPVYKSTAFTTSVTSLP